MSDFIAQATVGYGYCRVSTGKQAASGLSLEDQKVKIAAYATMKGIKLLEIFTDAGITGTSMEKRPAFTEMMQKVESGQVIIAWTLSRMSRSFKDMTAMIDDMERKKIQLVCIKDDIDTTTAMGRAFQRFMITINALEVEMVSERTVLAMQRASAQGRAIGRPPYGWRVINSDKQGSGFEEVPEEQAVIDLIHRLRYPDPETVVSWYSVTKYLNDQNVRPPAKAKQWYKSTVRSIEIRGRSVATKGRPGVNRE